MRVDHLQKKIAWALAEAFDYQTDECDLCGYPTTDRRSTGKHIDEAECYWIDGPDCCEKCLGYEDTITLEKE